MRILLAALIALLWAAPVSAEEARCTELGGDCLCSEPLDFATTLTAAGSPHDPPDSTTKECRSATGGSGLTVGIDQTPVTAASVGLTGPTNVFRFLQEDSNGKLDDDQYTFTDGTWCKRYYEHFSSGVTAPTTADQNIKEGRNEKEQGQPHPGLESEWSHDAGGSPSNSFLLMKPRYQNSDFGQGPKFLPLSGDTITLQDAMDEWIRVEICYDHNAPGYGTDTLVWRGRITNIGTGEVQLHGPSESTSTSPTAHSGTVTRIISAKTGEGGFSLAGESRYFSHLMTAKKDVADPTFWIGAASEIEGGGGECAVQPNLFNDTSSIPGFPFASDCVAAFPEEYNFRSPSPTTMPHSIGNFNDETPDTTTHGNATCIQSSYTPASFQFTASWPDFSMQGSDMIIHNEATFSGDMVFDGDRVNWLDVNGGSITGTVSCGTATNVTYNGECICGAAATWTVAAALSPTGCTLGDASCNDVDVSLTGTGTATPANPTLHELDCNSADGLGFSDGGGDVSNALADHTFTDACDFNALGVGTHVVTVRSTRGGVVATDISAFTVSAPAIDPDIPGGGTVIFEEPFDINDAPSDEYEDRGWYNVNATGDGDSIDAVEMVEGTGSFRCDFTTGNTSCADGAPKRHTFSIDSDRVYMGFWMKLSADWDDDTHIFHLMTNADDDVSGAPANSRLTTYTDIDNTQIKMGVQDSQNVDLGCYRSPNAPAGLGFECPPGVPQETQTEIDAYAFTENRSVAACNGVQGRFQCPNGEYWEDCPPYDDGGLSQDRLDCYDAGSYIYSGRWWLEGRDDWTATCPGATCKSEWHYVEVYYEMNTITGGVADVNGKIRWVQDGVTLMAADDILFRTNEHPSMEFDKIILAPYISSTSARDQELWIDELVVATGRPDSTPTIQGGVAIGAGVTIN